MVLLQFWCSYKWRYLFSCAKCWTPVQIRNAQRNFYFFQNTHTHTVIINKLLGKPVLVVSYQWLSVLIVEHNGTRFTRGLLCLSRAGVPGLESTPLEISKY